MSNLPAGYKQTEVGVIPGDWELKRLGEIVEKFVNGGTPSTKNEALWNGNIPWITGADILNQKVTEIRRHITTDAVKNSSTNVISKGNLLLVSRTGVGKLAIAPFDIAISQDFTGIYPKKESLLAEYLFGFFDFNQSFLKSQNQGTSIQGVTRETLSALSIPLPTKAEQTAIATALSDADALIQSLAKLIAKKRLIKQGAMQELLKPKEGWVVKMLGEICEINMGQSPSSSNYNASGVGLPLVQGNADIADRKTIIRNYTSQITKRCNTGDIIMSVRAPVGEIALATFDTCIGRGVCAISYPNAFLYHYLIFIESKWAKYSTGSTFDSVNSDTIWTLEINTPPPPEQTRIATILSDMDAEISALETKLAKYKQIKQGMMQNLLTGKIRLV